MAACGHGIMSTKWTLYRVFRAVSVSEPSAARKYASRRSHIMAACGHGILAETVDEMLAWPGASMRASQGEVEVCGYRKGGGK